VCIPVSDEGGKALPVFASNIVASRFFFAWASSAWKLPPCMARSSIGDPPPWITYKNISSLTTTYESKQCESGVEEITW
jgi:hypothetical protein